MQTNSLAPCSKCNNLNNIGEWRHTDTLLESNYYIAGYGSKYDSSTLTYSKIYFGDKYQHRCYRCIDELVLSGILEVDSVNSLS